MTPGKIVRRLALLALLLVLWSIPARSESSSLDRELKRIGKIDIEKALSMVEGDFSSLPPRRAAAVLLAAAPLTEPDTLGAMRLYIAIRSRLDPRLAASFVSALSNSDPVVRIYALSFLDVLRPPGLASVLFRLAAYDPDDNVSALAARMLGFYGMKGVAAVFRASFTSLHKDRAADLLFRLAATTQVAPSLVEKAVEALGAPSPHALAALAACGSPRTFEYASSPAWKKALLVPWVWSLLSEADPAKALALFREAVLPSVPRGELPDYAERLSEAAEARPEDALSLASALARYSTRAALALLRSTPHPDAVKRAEALVLSADRVMDRLNYAAVLLAMGDYAFADTLVEWLNSREFAPSPRRLVWCSNLLSYYRRREALPIVKKALAASSSLPARAAAVAPLARLDAREALPVLKKLVEEFGPTWRKALKGDLSAPYSSTPLPSLARAIGSLSAAAAELPPSDGLPLVKGLLEAAGPYFASDILSAASRWPGDPKVLAWLHSLLDGPFSVSLAAANVLAFAGDATSCELLAKKASPPSSLAFSLAALSSAASLQAVQLPDGRMGAAGRLAALRASLPKTFLSPSERGRRLLPSPKPNSDLFAAAGKLIGPGSSPAVRFLVLRRLQEALSSPFTRLSDYHPAFHLHDPGAVLAAAWAAARR